MKRLLWKEFREKWIWLVALVAFAIVPILCGDRYFFIEGEFTNWTSLSLLVALVFGASAYSSELVGGTADFIRSRPASWLKLLAAKLIVAVGFIVVTMILAAGVYRIVCPEQYIRFAGLYLAIRVLVATIFVGLSYICGFLFSAVLPSLFGGLFLMLMVLISCALEFGLYEELKLTPLSQWSVPGRFIGAAVATLLIARFGLTLPTNRRIIPFVMVVGLFALIGAPLNFIIKSAPITHLYNMSDNGRYAAMEEQVGGEQRPIYYLVRVADGKKRRVSFPARTINWISPNTVWFDGNMAAVMNGDCLWMGRMDSSGRLHQVNMPLGSNSGQLPVLASPPSGKFVSVNDPKTGRLTLADLEHLRPLKVTLSGVKDYWWQSDTEVCYIDKQGVRHIIQVI